MSLRHPGDAAKAAFFDLGALFGHVITRLPGVFAFFSGLIKLAIKVDMIWTGKYKIT